MHVQPISTGVIRPGESLLPILQDALPRPLQNGDIVCAASKIVSMEQGRLVRLEDVEPSPAARALPPLDPSRDVETSARLAELVLREADRVYPAGVIWLTLKDGVLIANAGIDASNAPPGHVILWPARPWEWAHGFWRALQETFGIRNVGVIITDARSMPLRRGFIGVALAFWGFEGVDVQRGRPDIFGRPLQFTERMLADGLAAAAALVGGEAAEQTPFVLIEDAPVHFTDRAIHPKDVSIPAHVDIFAPIYSEEFKDVMAKFISGEETRTTTDATTMTTLGRSDGEAQRRR